MSTTTSQLLAIKKLNHLRMQNLQKDTDVELNYIKRLDMLITKLLEERGHSLVPTYEEKTELSEKVKETSEPSSNRDYGLFAGFKRTTLEKNKIPEITIEERVKKTIEPELEIEDLSLE